MKKVVLITGAAKGIGRAIALEFEKNGYNVCITYNSSEEKAKELAKKHAIDIYKMDIENEQEMQNVVDSIVKKYGKIDCLVNNSGICDYSLFTDITKETFESILNVNFLGAALLTKYALKKCMLHNKNGSIINIASVWGSVGSSCEVHYSASKAAMIGMTKALAKELAPSNITVNSVSPGIIDTDMLSRFGEEEKQLLEDRVPLLRIGKPEDVSGIVLFLASDGARYITGQDFLVDGGLSING